MLQTLSNNFLSPSFDDHRKNLLKVSSKYHCNATKRPFIISNVLKRDINSFLTKAILHWNFIPYNEINSTDEISQSTLLLYIASFAFKQLYRDFECRVGCSTTYKE